MMLETSANINSIIWIMSCAETEIGASKRVIDDLQINLYGVHIETHAPKSRLELISLLNDILIRVFQYNLKPILHIDMHGDKNKGLYLVHSNEYISWSDITDWFRYINAAFHNNLIILSTACYSLHSILEVRISKPSPYFIYIAPEIEISIGFIADHILNFYVTLFKNLSIDDAYNHIQAKFEYFHCEKTLFLAIAKYIQTNCRGKIGREKVENRLTEFMSSQNHSDNPLALTEARKRIKFGIKPSQELLNKYSETFLINKQCSFTMKQLVDFLNLDT